MSKSIKIILSGKEYSAVLNNNNTVDDIISMMPMELTLKRYGGHEYYCALTHKPSIKGVPMTSDAHAGGIYYYDGWTAFTILFGNANIAPFEVVHIGDVNEDIISTLTAAGETVKVLIDVIINSGEK